ncbi:HK97 family phage prohead protease [Vibrio cholerae]
MSIKKQYLDLEIKSLDSNQEIGLFTAYANTKWHVDNARDCTVDNAYSRSIRLAKETGRMPKMLLQHDHNKVIGVWLEMEEDEHGLRVKGQLALNTTLGRETYELMKLGALDSLSIGYIVKEEQYNPEQRITYLIDLDIKEISIVTFPCDEQSLVDSVKSEVVNEETKSAEEVTESLSNQEATLPESNDLQELNNTDEESVTTSLSESPDSIPQLESKLNNLCLSIKLNSFLKSISPQL